ncbi:MAG: PfkB family carbohydrate kinase, partial [Pseudomonadota bacterium]
SGGQPDATWATDGTNVLTLPAASASRVIDTTGAGDAFAAGLVYATARGWPIEAALALGNQWGADAVGHLASGCPPDHKPNLVTAAMEAQITQALRVSEGNVA